MIEVEMPQHGIAVFKKCLPEHVCDGVMDVMMNKGDGLSVDDHTSGQYRRGISYRARVLHLGKGDDFSNQFMNHIQAIRSNYFKLLGLEDKSEIKHFSNLEMMEYRVDSDDRFTMHFDAEGDTASRGLAMIWYLEDVQEGGETAFPYYNVKIKPSKGDCLVFAPFWNFAHVGKEVVSNNKYTLITFGCNVSK